MRQNFLTSHAISILATGASTATTNADTTAVDSSGYDSVTFIRTTSAIRIFNISGGTTSTNATTDLAGTFVTATAGATVMIEVIRPSYRYLAQQVADGTTSVLGDCVCIRGIARSKAVSNSGAVIVATPTDA
jgi:hypothetical protein